jgi:3-oxoadipate enol-lactonase
MIAIMDRGEHEFRGLMGAAPQDGLAELRQRSPRMYEQLLSAFGGPLSQPELGRADREIATVAMLATLGGSDRQLTLHTRAALRQGVSPAALIALCQHVAVYAGMPRALNALAVVDQALTEEGIPRPAALREVRLSDHSTTVAQRGETGSAVVLLHAICLDWQMWDAVMTQLSHGRRVYAYDLRGHGSAAGAPAARSVADTAADLIGVLDALGLERAHVVGLSYGGAVAQTAAVNHPARFESLSLVATGDQAAPDVFEDRARSAEKDGMAAQIPQTLLRWFTPEALATNAWGVRYARECVLRADPADWAGSWRSFTTLDVHGKLGDFPAPALVLSGQADLSATPGQMRGLAERIPGSRYEEIAGGPHMLSLECPDQVAAVLADFIP